MIKTVLEIINDEMNELGIDYHFMYNDKEQVTYPYVTGEYYETGYSNENKMTTGQLLLEAWTRATFIELMQLNDTIKTHFDMLQMVKDNVAVAFEFSNMESNRTDETELKKITMYIDIVYWKGN